MNFESLPKNWKLTELREIGEIVSGGTPSTKSQDNFGGNIGWITPADLTNYIGKHISHGRRNLTEKGLNNSSAKLLPKGSVLFSSRAPIGYVAIASNELCTNQGFKSIIPKKSIFNDYVYYYLKIAKSIIENYASGTTFKEISGKRFGQIPIPIPPLPEQHRIVAKIEELFSELENGIASLKKAKEQLKVYRKSILKNAFEGQLKNTNIHFSDKELSAAWKWVKLKNVADITSSKRIFKKDYTMEGIPFYRTKEIKELSEGQEVSLKLYISSKKYNGIKESYSVPKQGDLLLSAVGTIGVTYVVKDDKPFYFKDGNLMWLRSLKGVLPKFLSYSLTNFIRNKQSAKMAGSTYNALTIETMKDFEIPLPPLSEQLQIIQTIESSQTIANNLEKTIDQSIQQSEALKLSILKQAFEGKLVPQDPSDEPVELGSGSIENSNNKP